MRKKNKIRVITSLMAGLFCLIMSNTACTQTSDQVLLRVGDEEITLSHFKEVYRKNNLESMIAEPKEVDEYMEMYTDFRLKVLAAKELGLDTNASFIEELAGYREQLAQQYFSDHEVTDQLVREAWERSQYDVRASHILINLDQFAPPEDTLQVYEQMMEIRERILGGEDFGDLAREMSDDPSAQDREASGNQPARKGNAGDLGYFTVFNMVYPFETAAFNTEVGEVSMPVRSNFGYHLVKVTDRLPAMGRARVAHIMLMTPEGTSEEELAGKNEMIHDLHQQLLEGADFAELATEYSEDRQSSARGGEMAPFTSNRMVPQFIKAISELHETGDLSEPLQSNFGWHIIKLIEKTPPPQFEEAKAELQHRIQRDNRSMLSQKAVIHRLKEDYRYRGDEKALHELYEVVDELVFQGLWEIPGDSKLDRQLARFGSVRLSQQDFLEYVAGKQRRQNPTDLRSYIHRMYDEFIRDELFAYEDQQLEDKYPEFRAILEEYHDGILLFEITDQKVWSKASRDTIGLREFFENNSDEYTAEGLQEVRGLVIADYQNYLERKWLAELRQRFPVWVDEDLLHSIVIE